MFDNMRASEYFQKIFMSRSGVSSKRIAGFLGWLVCLFIAVYCTLNIIQAPVIAEILFYCSSGLLGIDAIMSPFRKGHERSKNNMQQMDSNKGIQCHDRIRDDI